MRSAISTFTRLQIRTRPLLHPLRIIDVVVVLELGDLPKTFRLRHHLLQRPEIRVIATVLKDCKDFTSLFLSGDELVGFLACDRKGFLDHGWSRVLDQESKKRSITKLTVLATSHRLFGELRVGIDACAHYHEVDLLVSKELLWGAIVLCFWMVDGAMHSLFSLTAF
jgi:hypothetical protein